MHEYHTLIVQFVNDSRDKNEPPSSEGSSDYEKACAGLAKKVPENTASATKPEASIGSQRPVPLKPMPNDDNQVSSEIPTWFAVFLLVAVTFGLLFFAASSGWISSGNDQEATAGRSSRTGRPRITLETQRKLEQWIRSLDSQKLLFSKVQIKTIAGDYDILQVVTTREWHRQDYRDRLQVTTVLHRKCESLGLNPSAFELIDSTGNVVGGVGFSGVWVDEH